MNISQIESNIETLTNDLKKDSFIYDFLSAYGTPNATIKKLQIGTLNLLNKTELFEEGTSDILWKKKLFFKVVEDQNLLSYIDALRTNEAVSKQQPRFLIVTDFKTLLAYDTKTNDSLDCDFLELNKNFSFFLPLAGMEKAQHQVESIADVKAAEKMAKLYDEIRKDNHTETKEEVHSLNVFLSRLLFCFFAEDTGIFDLHLFTHSISEHTQKDGSDLKEYLERLFAVMNTADKVRKDLPSHVEAFPYVNGGLFQDPHPAPSFNRRSRQLLLDCGELNWSEINPDIFGSMIQAVITPEHRGGLGMHYTSVPNIMKVIEPLFLNDLKEAFENVRNEPKKLMELLHRLSQIKIFDPACGSGNFLIIAYKELRLLEIQIIQQLQELNKATLGFSPDQLELIPKQQITLAAQYQVELFSRIDVTQFYGIEIDDFAHEIAILALWLVQHQMNVQFKNIFGTANPTLPLQAGGNIIQGNATRIDWNVVCPKKKNDEIYILGNPPYLGARIQSMEQKSDMAFVFNSINGFNNLDYIACWFLKGGNYVEGINAKFAIVSTNSICQGEQVPILWPNILKNGIEIGFAYKSFLWSNNAKNKAAVFCSIISLQNKSNNEKFIFTHNIKKTATKINAYLIDSKPIYITKRSSQLSNLPDMVFGSMPNDGGYLLFNDIDKVAIENEYPISKAFFKKIVGAQEFTSSTYRWCLWVTEKDLKELVKIPQLKKRIDQVKDVRLKSTRLATKKLAAFPYLFGEIRHQDFDSIVVPSTTSSRREYVPIGFFNNETIINNRAHVVYNSEPYLFAILSSKIHILWLASIAGRLKDDFLYSSSICYNNFPISKLSESQKQVLTNSTFRILEERERHTEKTITELYDPNKMPAGLREAHRQNDLAVERCYRIKPFESDEERLEYLFKLYEQMIAKEKDKGSLFEAKKKTRKTKKQTT